MCIYKLLEKDLRTETIRVVMVSNSFELVCERLNELSDIWIEERGYKIEVKNILTT